MSTLLAGAEATSNYELTQIGEFQPVRLLQVEITEPIPDLERVNMRNGQSYSKAQVLVRLHTRPLGLIDIEIEENGVSADSLSSSIWRALGQQINDHLVQYGASSVSQLTPEGLPVEGAPAYIRERDELLKTAPFVSVIVATRNRADSLPRTLDSLLELDYPNYEIIVVDNAPSDETTAALVEQRYGHLYNVRYVREDRPGLGSAHNGGLQFTDAPFVAFTDDDVLLDRYWLCELMRGFFVTKNVGCVTGMIMPAELETQAQMWIEQFGGFSKGFERKIFDLNDNRHSSVIYPFNLGVYGSGANMAFRTSALREIGLFDPCLGAGTAAMAGDDLVGFFEIIHRGYKLVYEPAAILQHFHRQDYAGLRRQVYGYGVGLVASLVSIIMRHPQLLLAILLRVPAGVHYLLDPKSTKNVKKQADYPEELTRHELQGMIYAPFAYLKSLWQGRKYARPPHVRDYVQAVMSYLQYRFDVFASMYSRGIPRSRLYTEHTKQTTGERWKVIAASLRDYSIRSAIEIGCKDGRLCFLLADKGIPVIGIDHDKRALRIAGYTARRTGTHHVSFTDQMVTPQSVSLLPRADTVILLSQWHDWAARYDLKTAKQMLSNIWGGCNQVMYFEVHPNEMPSHCSLPGDSAEVVGWFMDFVMQACPDSVVEVLKEFKADDANNDERISSILLVIKRITKKP